ncbi:exosortase C-terminal domain/associated protein EpsI [Derxia lacustris]|uniref:exosortase C-terminal domain/associated protein EpsI n=1 Tax=Derxia lacustris TaxID=764842 RepID=UPI000A174685|nr:exosortase C-terminal domain/associated protein EpsI [Derxia lacustris]
MSALAPGLPRVPLAFAFGLAVAMGCAPLLSDALRPTQLMTALDISLESGVPTRLRDWVVVPSPAFQASLDLVGDGDGQDNTKPYDQVVMRDYRNEAGAVVMLAIAYARVQRQEVKIHRPDLCYRSQGFEVQAIAPASFALVSESGVPVVGRRLLARRADRLEAVVYWLRTGTQYSDRAWDARLQIFTDGLEGRVPDGVLVRASQIVASPGDAEAAWAQLETFLADLVAGSSADIRPLLLR